MKLVESLVRTARRRSAWMFHANSGSCNGCDIEFLACLTPRFDIEQLGIRHEGSPRHADVLVVSGPVTRGTCEALETVYAQMPDPKVVVALGSCPASCNVFAGSPVVVGPLHRVLPVDVYVPGCPPRPDAIIAAIAEAAAILAGDEPRPADRPVVVGGTGDDGGQNVPATGKGSEPPVAGSTTGPAVPADVVAAVPPDVPATVPEATGDPADGPGKSGPTKGEPR